MTINRAEQFLRADAARSTADNLSASRRFQDQTSRSETANDLIHTQFDHQLEAQGQIIDDLKNQIKDLEQGLGTIQDSIRGATDKIRSDSLQVLALFVALFSFVSIEFQLFKTAEATYIVPLSLLFMGALLLFVLVFVAILKKRASKLLVSFLFLTMLSVMTLGIMLYYQAKNEARVEATKNGVPTLCSKIKDDIVRANQKKDVESVKQYSQSYTTLLCSESGQQ